MDNNRSNVTRGPQLLGIFKTVYLFLLNHNCPKSAETFKNECGLYSGNIDFVSSKSLVLKKCKCAKNQANQTDTQNQNTKGGKHEWLEGTYEGGPLQMKDDQAHIFYVCDHCQQTHENNRKQEGCPLEAQQKDKNTDKGVSQKCELVTLQSKFSELQGEHQKLIAVTSELTTALQMNIIGQTKNIYSVLEHCKSIYPSLFTPASPQIPIFENLVKESKTQGLFGSGGKGETGVEYEDAGTREVNRKEDGPRQKSETPEFNQYVEHLNLDNLSPRSPSRSPLTPETVRQILGSVFDKIFELEKAKRQGREVDGPLLSKDNVEKIVNDVLNDFSKTPNNFLGAGEGEISRPESTRDLTVMRSEHFFDVDYAKIKRDLTYSDNEKKIRILQALRWRITKNDGSMREKFMDSYVSNDVLDLTSSISLPEKILFGLGSDLYVQESTCRFINTLASVRQGRDYLMTDEKLLKRVLIRKVKEIKGVTSAVIRNMLVASVQKLSIRKHCRTLMVHEGLFEVMVDYLEEFYDKLSRYCLEYCSALLMNLCLVDEAKHRSTRNPKKVIGLIRKFLEGENECCLPYVNGVMFSLLERDEVVNEAKNQHLDKLLIRLIRITNNENIRKQLDFIVQSRLFGKGDTSVTDHDEENRDEVDLLEIELDQDDFITPLPSGEKLLEEYKAGYLCYGDATSGKIDLPLVEIRTNRSQKKSPNCVSFSTMRRDPPNSAKSFSEETKQLYHKPNGGRGIFEGKKARRFTTCSQNVIINHVKTKKTNPTSSRYPATPLCYMENCQRLNEGTSAQCTCHKCAPEQSRYSCGCYDAICREINEADHGEHNNYESNYSPHVDYSKNDSKSSQLPLPQITDKATPDNDDTTILADTTHLSQQHTNENDDTVIAEQKPHDDNKNGGRTGSGCKVCGEKKCECAFDSRPKLCRTPTL